MTRDDKVREYFDERAEEEWDRLGDTLHGRILHRIHLALLERHLPETGRVLDVGCGAGRFALDVLARGLEVTLADISSPQLALARDKIREAGLEAGVESAHRLDVRDLSVFPDGSFDAVICFGAVLAYVRQGAAKAVAELRRVTKPGGVVFVSTPGLWGTLRFGVVLDPPETYATFEDHIEWDGESALEEILSTRIGSPEFHVPMTFYTARSLRRLLESGGLEVLSTAAAAPLSTRGQYEQIEQNEEAADLAMRLELQAATRPELVDSGEHLIVAARVNPR